MSDITTAFNLVLHLPRSLALSHIVRQSDRTSIGVWGLYQLRSAFQPIFAFTDGKLSAAAYEGLIRPTRDGQPLSPGEFFSTFTALERFHIETLTRTLHFLNAAEFLDARSSIFVNFDPKVFTDRQVSDGAFRDMRLVLHEAGIDPARVVCEVTENQSASEEVLRGFVAQLRDNGFRIAVDDYGADDSDLSRVQELKPDIVKFDSIWISRLMASSAGAALLKAMVSSFRDQGIESIFEGLEEGWQLEVAERCEVSMVQGYVLARPQIVPVNFSQFVRDGERVDPHVMFEVSEPAGTETPAAHHQMRGVRPARPFGRRQSN